MNYGKGDPADWESRAQWTWFILLSTLSWVPHAGWNADGGKRYKAVYPIVEQRWRALNDLTYYKRCLGEHAKLLISAHRGGWGDTLTCDIVKDGNTRRDRETKSALAQAHDSLHIEKLVKHVKRLKRNIQVAEDEILDSQLRFKRRKFDPEETADMASSIKKKENMVHKMQQEVLKLQDTIRSYTTLRND